MKSIASSGRATRTRDLPTTVGIQIRAARDAEGLTQGQLAEAVGRTRAAVSLWEAGERMPAVDDLLAVAAALDRAVDFFLPARTEETKRESAAVLLRAVASQLSGARVGTEVAQVVREADRHAPPLFASFHPRTRDPIEAAQELLSAMRATRPPIDVDAAASLCGVFVIRRRFSNDALSGFLYIGQHRTIGVNALHTDARQRFTLGHELGHLVLGHHADFHIDLFSPVSAGDPPEYDWRQERAANTFAANLLMPSGLIRHDRVEGNQTLATLARKYRVSEEAMGIRLTALGLS